MIRELLAAVLMVAGGGAVAEDATIAFEYGLDKRCEPVIKVLEVEPAVDDPDAFIPGIRAMLFLEETAGPEWGLGDGAIRRTMMDGSSSGPPSRAHGLATCLTTPTLTLFRIWKGPGQGEVDLDEYADDELVISRLMRLDQFVFRQDETEVEV